MIRGDRAAAHAVDEHRNVRGLRERDERTFGVAPIDVATRDHHRTFGGRDEGGDRPDVGGIRVGAAARGLVDGGHLDARGPERVERDVDEGGASVGRAGGDARGVELGHDRRG